MTLKAESLTVDSTLHSITSALYSVITNIINELNDFMTIVITNKYERQVLPHQSLIHYIFPTEWADRINVESNINSFGSKIEDSFTESFDIDISYMNDYLMFITCSFNDTAVVNCNINLFKQTQVPCMNQVKGSVCLNPASIISNSSALPFFITCAEIIYTYFKDDKTNVSNFKSNLISCCIDLFCEAFLRQKRRKN